MESRMDAFKIIEPLNTQGELKNDPIIQKINIIIKFINTNRYRHAEDRDGIYQKNHPEATLSKDIQAREAMALSLYDPENILEMAKEVERVLQNKFSSSSQAKKEYQKFTTIIDEFLKSVIFKNSIFAHLTAAELAIVGMTIDALLILFYQLQRTLQDDKGLCEITEKQKEVLHFREKLITCMKYHVKVFQENQMASESQAFWNNDILLNLIGQIEIISGISLTKEKKDLWPDMSYLYALPRLHLIKQDEPKTVAQYFVEYINALPPGIEEVDRLADDIREELNLLEEEPFSVEALQLKEEEIPAGWGCFPYSFWSKPVYEAPSPVREEIKFKENEVHDKAQQKLEPVTIDDVLKLISNFEEREKEQTAKLNLFESLRKDIRDLQNKLQKEIDDLLTPSCLSFLRRHTLRKKLAKNAALKYVLESATLTELGQRAYDELNGDKKVLVRAGWRSRTEALLMRVVEAAAIECDSTYKQYTEKAMVIASEEEEFNLL